MKRFDGIGGFDGWICGDREFIKGVGDVIGGTDEIEGHRDIGGGTGP
jgi:hypothetical protein